MWKDWFYFTRSERNGIFFLSLLIMAVLLFRIFALPQMVRAAPDPSDYAEEVAEFEAALRKSEVVADTFLFDPNTADSATFVRLGLPNYIAQRIVRFREKNGVFRSPDDFFKIYGVTKEKYGYLKDFVQIAERKGDKPKIAKREATDKPQSSKPAQSVNLNKADTTELKMLRGIGSKLASRIVKYRELVGGFHCKKQLREVYGLSAETYLLIESSVYVNREEAKRFSREDVLQKGFYHPYLNKNKLKTIKMMLQREEVLSKSAITETGEFTDEDLEKLSWYFIFVGDEKTDD